MKPRPLTTDEITRLKANSCHCADWSHVTAKASIDPDNYHNVRFSGNVTLGAHGTLDVPRPYICDTHIANCHLDTDVVIQGTRMIENYTIGHDVRIIGCGTITARATGAHRVEINVLDETGSKQILAYPGLNSNIAALACADDDIRESINRPDTNPVALATIAAEAVIEGASLVNNVYVGAHARIGHNVIAEDCIISTCAIVTNATQISHCFVGECVTLSNFTAQHSMFFANSHLCNGEAASVLAGPFTVSEHKSTLLIGAQLMMFNAGSGTNQSNHLYKLGPVHHGSMGRGCKCASDSYIMWPAQIGDFTMVSGRHYTHPDTRLFPFSYLIAGKDGASILLPGENLSKCGTARDIAKWPARDKRRFKRDHIDFDALNPVTISAMLSALPLLRQAATAGTDLRHSGDVTIPHRAAAKGIRYYINALQRYFGQKAASIAASGFGFEQPDITGLKWVDMGGKIMTGQLIAEIKESISNGDTAATDTLIEQTSALIETQWACHTMRRYARDIYGTDFDLRTVLTAWQQAEEEHLTLVLADAAKEAKMAGRPALATDDPALNALRERLIEVRRRVAELL